MSGAERLPRLTVLLLTLQAEERLTAPMLAERTGWTPDVASKALQNAAYYEFVERAEREDGSTRRFFRLTDKGRAKAATCDPREVRLAAAQGSECDRALALIGAAPDGLDSEALADALGLSSDQVDALLADHVAGHRLVTCGVQRTVDGALLQLRLYRTSMAGASSRRDFRISGQAVAARTPAQAPVPPQAQALAVAARELDDAIDDMAAPAAVPEATAQALADRVVATAGEAVKVQVFECDIDAVHRKHERLPVRSQIGGLHTRVQCATLPVDDDDGDDFTCALSDRSRLSITSNGRKLKLPLAHTRRLLHYLDGLHGDEIVERAAGAAVA